MMLICQKPDTPEEVAQLLHELSSLSELLIPTIWEIAMASNRGTQPFATSKDGAVAELMMMVIYACRHTGPENINDLQAWLKDWVLKVQMDLKAPETTATADEWADVINMPDDRDVG